MADKENLYILWTNDNPVTAEKMVFMYGLNSLKRGWWQSVTIIIWGATAQLVAANEAIQAHIKKMQAAGVAFTACKACADQLGVSAQLEQLDIAVEYWGEPLTRVLKSEATLFTV